MPNLHSNFIFLKRSLVLIKLQVTQNVNFHLSLIFLRVLIHFSEFFSVQLSSDSDFPFKFKSEEMEKLTMRSVSMGGTCMPL